MSTTRRRRVAVVRRPQAARPALSPYHRTRAGVGLAVFILIFGILWLINGSFTADYVMRTFRTTVLWGWSAHLLMTAIEIAPVFVAPFLVGMPRAVHVILWLLSLPFGVLDVLSSAVGVQPWMLWTGALGIVQHVQNAALGEVIAFLPEPMLIWLLLALLRTRH